MMEKEIRDKARDIVCQLKSLGQSLEAHYQNDERLLYWVIPDKIACSHRPLRHHPLYGGSGRSIPQEATELVIEWVDTMYLLEIKSIICLMHERDLDYYNSLDLSANNLIDFYEKKGFKVKHIPWEDPQHRKTEPKLIEKKLKKVRSEALIAYNDLPKPVLIHCSAGIDRSAPVAAFIWFYNRNKISS